MFYFIFIPIRANTLVQLKAPDRSGTFSVAIHCSVDSTELKAHLFSKPYRFTKIL